MDKDVQKARDHLIQFGRIFAGLKLTFEEHTILTKAINEIGALLDRFEVASDWAQKYQDQCAELKAGIITTAIDAGASKEITL